MDKKKKTEKQNDVVRTIIRLFIVSWLALALFGFLYVNACIQNYKLKRSLSFFKRASDSLRSDLTEANKDKDAKGAAALNFLEWQYVIKDQVAYANQQLLDSVNKIKDLNQDKNMLDLLYYNLGLNYTLGVDFDKAIGAFEEALRYNPEDAYSYYNLGLLYSGYKGDSKKAAKNYRRYLEILPSGPKAKDVKERVQQLEKK